MLGPDRLVWDRHTPKAAIWHGWWMKWFLVNLDMFGFRTLTPKMREVHALLVSPQNQRFAVHDLPNLEYIFDGGLEMR